MVRVLSALTFVGCLAAVSIAGTTAAEPLSARPSPGRMPLLMPDDFSELHLAAWRVEPGRQDPRNPLIEGTMPWDRGGVGIHGSVFWDPIAKLWRAYLVCTPAEYHPTDSKKPWSSENHAHRRICLFESQDGVEWTRPALNNVSFGNHQSTNILFDTDQGVSAYSSVLVDPANRDWPYEMFVLRESWSAVKGKAPRGNGYYRYRSRDGKAWQPTGDFVNDPMKGDLCFFYRDPQEGYVAYYRLGGPRQPTDHVPAYEDFPRRSCFRATSKDGRKWARDPAMSLTADERDHRDTQYQECVPLKVPGGFVAMVTMYHPLTQTLDVRLAASRDGRRWWFPDRRPCLGNAPMGDYGGGMIWQSQHLIVEADKLHVYYGGTEGPHRQLSDTRAPSLTIGPETVIDHGAHFLPFHAALCRATWRYDRLYALISSAGGTTVGTATTKPRDLGGRVLHVNLQTRPAKKAAKPGLDQGFLQVELLDAEDRPLAGFTRQDCPQLHGDYTNMPVVWAGGTRAPATARKARFYLKRAFLYGFDFHADPEADGRQSGGQHGTAARAGDQEIRETRRPPTQLIGYTELRTNLPGGRHVNVRTMRAAVVRADGTNRHVLAEELVCEPDTWTQFAGWSPDGATAIIGRGWQHPENAAWEEQNKTFRFTKEGWLYDSYLIELSTGKSINVTAVERVSSYNSGLFFWPGNPARLGFTALIGGNSHPFSMDRDGRNKLDLTKGSKEFAYGFNSSPDGRRIAYHKNYQIYVADADGSNAVHIKTGHPFNFVPTWSPDGRWLLFLSGEHYNCHPHLVRSDGKLLRKLADRAGYRGVIDFLDVADFHGGSSDTPVWSADGQSVFYSAKVGGNVELFRCTLEGTCRQLTHSPPGTLNYHPQPSPDGRWLAHGRKHAGVRQLHLLRLSDCREWRLTDLKAGQAAMWPHWQPRPSNGT